MVRCGISVSKLNYVLYIIIVMALFWTLFIATNISHFCLTKTQSILVPNIIHYVIFDQSSINFITYLSILSALKLQKPDRILIHTNKKLFHGLYWKKIINYPSNTSIILNFMPVPTHTYGQLLSSVYHASDVARIHLLRTFGGIYLDTDVLVLNNLDILRQYEMVVGWPENESIGNQVLLAEKNSKFLKLWQEGYKHYRSRDWYYNAGKYPTEILTRDPHLAHYERTLLGVQYLIDKLHSAVVWRDWKYFYTIHLLSRHHDVTKYINETSLQYLNSNFANIAKYILNL